eukprot:gene13847-13963_t
MNFTLLPALLLFAFVTSITLGPNNLMLLTSGVNFGFRRTIPHMLGIGIGFTVMVAAIGLGLAQIFIIWPLAYTVLKFGGTLYMLWLAWKISQSGPVEGGKTIGQPMTFLQAAAFQWVNPKAWIMAISAISTYTVGGTVAGVLLVAGTFGAVNLPCVSSWALFGTAMRKVLGNPQKVRLFNAAMAILLVASLYPILREF